ncbi:MAG: RraA family protein [Variovorax sp.]|nr:MAG: RraA family protein [Variovorax sp.]
MNDDLKPIRREFTRVSAALAEQAARYGSSLIADVAGRRGALNGRIQPLSRSMKFAGPALTVEVRPGDNLMIHAALALAKPGDVMVVDGGAYLGAALTGFLMVSQARTGRLAAFVIDGAVRDVDETCSSGFPVFAAGTNPNGPTKAIGGKVNWPISVGNVAVNPGDLIIGDADGVVVVPREKTDEVVAAVQAKLEMEQQFLAGLAQGKVNNAWVTNALRAAAMLGADESL